MSEVKTELLNLSEAAAILGVHPSTVRLWADKGEVPSHRTAGGHRRFRRPDVEAWAAARQDPRLQVGPMLVQNALGRTRLQMSASRLRHEAWYQRLDEARRQEFRDSGHQLLAALRRHLAGDDPAALETAAAIGRDYEQRGALAGLSLAERVRLCQYFTGFLFESAMDIHQASGRPADAEWANLHRQVSEFANAVVLGLVEAHTSART